MDAGMKKRIIFIGLAAVILIVVLVRTTGNIKNVLFKKKPSAAMKTPGVAFEEEAVPVKVFKVKKSALLADQPDSHHFVRDGRGHAGMAAACQLCRGRFLAGIPRSRRDRAHRAGERR